VRTGKVRRARLYYLRGLTGKSARLDARETGEAGIAPAAKAEAKPGGQARREGREIVEARGPEKGRGRSGRRQVRLLDGRRFDADARRRAAGAILVGVDEAGRGPLAGPVVVAAVALPEDPSAELCCARDSKTLTPKSRERLFGVVRSQALAVSVAWAHPAAIDRDNILAATLSAMGRAARRAAAKSGGGGVLVLVDGPRAIRNSNSPRKRSSTGTPSPSPSRRPASSRKSCATGGCGALTGAIRATDSRSIRATARRRISPRSTGWASAPLTASATRR